MPIKGLVQGAAQAFVDSAIGKYLGHGEEKEKQGFNSQNLISSLSKSGVAHNGHFEVQLTAPKQAAIKIKPNPALVDVDQDGPGLTTNLERQMIYRAESCELPGRSLATVDHRFDNYAPISRVVTGQTYTDITISFLLSEDLREKEYFERWQESAVGTGAFSEYSASIAKNNVQYHIQYAGTVTIRQYGPDGTLRSVHNLEQAFPIVLGGVQMNWSDEGFARLVVSFSYNRYTAVFYHQDQAKKGMSGGFSLGPGGFSGSLNIPGIGSIGTDGRSLAGNLSEGSTMLGKKIFNAL